MKSAGDDKMRSAPIPTSPSRMVSEMSYSPSPRLEFILQNPFARKLCCHLLPRPQTSLISLGASPFHLEGLPPSPERKPGRLTYFRRNQQLDGPTLLAIHPGAISGKQCSI